MIISDTHRFVFVHIPKCAGTSVKNQLARYDERGGVYSAVVQHPQLGKIDLTHLPLQVLESFFPADYECVRTYRSFALCRDPHERFLSALLQKMMAYESFRRETLSRRDLYMEIDRVLNHLASGDIMHDHRYIYFAKQSSYVRLHGKKVLDEVFAVHRIDRFYKAAGEVLECGFDAATHQNRSLYARNSAIRLLVAGAWPLAKRVLPAKVADLRHHMKALVYRPSRERLGDVLNATEVQTFIESYYAEDLELFHSLS